MRSRSLTKRVEIYGITQVSDGFGGYTTTDTLLGSSWCSIKTFEPGKFNNLADFGILNPQDALHFRMRKRNDIVIDTENHYLKYRGKKYTISTAPVNINFEDDEIAFIGVQEQTKSNEAAP